MNITLLSISHHTAPVAIREKLALSDDQLGDVFARWRRQFPIAELVVVCTCNRVEWYIARPIHQPPDVDELRSFVAQTSEVDESAITASSIQRDNQSAVEHLFRVTCGLESMVLGEAQILGQIKRSYETAVTHDGAHTAMHSLFQEALSVGKHVRSSTGIDQGHMSVGSVAIDFAKQIFEKFDDKTVVGIGAGDMAKLTLRHLQALGPQRLWLVNRSIDRAREVAAALGIDDVRQFDDMDQLLIEADVLITSTGATEPIVTAARFKPLLRRRRLRPLFIIDLAVPRDVEPAVGSLSNVYLYNIDDLQEVVRDTQAQRSQEAEQATTQVLEASAQCMTRIQNHDIGRLIKELRGRLHELGRLEQERTLHKLEHCEPDHLPQLLEEHTNRLVNKILHLPISQLDRRQPASALGFFAAALRRLFRLDSNPLQAEEQREPAPVEQTSHRAE